MKKNKTIIYLFLMLFVVVSFWGISRVVFGEELTGEIIMNRVDDNHFIASGYTESELIIYDRGREIKKEMTTYIKTENDVTNALVEFVNPRDRGTKYFLQDNELWMYFPDAEDLVHISGHMLEEGMMGSDFSYQDLLESEQLTDLYEFEKEGEELINGREVYVIDARAREGKKPAYYQRKFWVDKQRFVILREEMYARGGRLLKVMESKQIKEIEEGRWFPMKMVMEDKLRDDTETIYRMNKIELDYDIPENKLSLDELQ